jgi:hypothetical protein
VAQFDVVYSLAIRLEVVLSRADRRQPLVKLYELKSGCAGYVSMLLLLARIHAARGDADEVRSNQVRSLHHFGHLTLRGVRVAFTTIRCSAGLSGWRRRANAASTSHGSRAKVVGIRRQGFCFLDRKNGGYDVNMTKLTIAMALAFLSTAISANAETYNYSCKLDGKTHPLWVDDSKNTLEWRAKEYRIASANGRDKVVCAKAGWHAERNGTSFDFCVATQGYADIEKDGNVEVECELKKR